MPEATARAERVEQQRAPARPRRTVTITGRPDGPPPRRPESVVRAAPRTDSLLAEGESALSALNSGFHVAYLIGAGLVAVAFVVALALLRSPSPEEMAAAHGGDGHEGATEDSGEPDPALAEFV